MTDIQKIKVSKEEFAEVLYYWLFRYLSKKDVKSKAKDLKFRIKSNQDFNRIFQELFVLNIWIIIHSCEIVFKDEDKRNECLDIFHRLVYERNVQGTEENFSNWMILMSTRYSAYGNAMATYHPSTPLWVVADVFYKNLLGEITKDLGAQTTLIAYTGLSVKYLEEAIMQYDIQ